jgi:hypothetical protein
LWGVSSSGQAKSVVAEWFCGQKGWGGVDGQSAACTL